MKPHWEDKHDWWIEDIRFELHCIDRFKKLLIKHPDDSMGDVFREQIKLCKKKLTVIVRDYSKLYGDKPNLRRLRDEVETKQQPTFYESYEKGFKKNSKIGSQEDGANTSRCS